MASIAPPAHSVPETWTALNTVRRKKGILAEDVARLLASCESGCGKKHVAECPDCYKKVVERMQADYSEPGQEEWFSQRSDFLSGLEGLFSKAKDGKTSLEVIDKRIASEKNAWFCDTIASHPDLFLAADTRLDQEELRTAIGNPKNPIDDVMEMVKDAMGEPPNWAEKVDAFVAQVVTIGEDKAALKKLYVDAFFKDEATGDMLPDAQRFVDMYESGDDMSIEDVMDKIVLAIKEERQAQPQREQRRKRLDELRRAKTAFEQNKRAGKGKLQGGQPAVGEDLYNLPPCYVCRRDVGPKAVFSCTICQVITQMGGEKRLTVYCSRDCFYEGHDEHTEKAHECEAGDQCVQEREEDVSMDGSDDWPVACKECVAQKQVALFCTWNCATQNLERHRRDKHGVKTAAEEVEFLVQPADALVQTTLERENPGLKFMWAE